MLLIIYLMARETSGFGGEEEWETLGKSFP